MSSITERLMKGEYISKAECFQYSESIDRAMAVYPQAMAAMERYERQMANCICEYDGDLVDGEMVGYRSPNPACPVHCEEDEELAA